MTTTATHTKTIDTGMRYIGRTRAGDRVYIQLELRHHGPQVDTEGRPIVRMTTDHRAITGYDELAITGCVVPKGHRNAHTWGQITEALHEMRHADLAIPVRTLAALRRLWETKHLNGMQGACIHQDDGAHIDREGVSTYPGGWYRGDAWARMQAEQTAKCPHGYVYGSSWLVNTLPEQDIQAARDIAARLMTQPLYIGN